MFDKDWNARSFKGVLAIAAEGMCSFSECASDQSPKGRDNRHCNSSEICDGLGSRERGRASARGVR